MQKIQTEKEDLQKLLENNENEKNQILAKFDQFGVHLQEQHANQVSQIT